MDKVLVVRLKGRERGSNTEFKRKINFDDWRQLAYLFMDFSTHGAKVEKAFNEFLRLKDERFPW